MAFQKEKSGQGAACEPPQTGSHQAKSAKKKEVNKPGGRPVAGGSAGPELHFRVSGKPPRAKVDSE
jgi:hypothetical protein